MRKTGYLGEGGFMMRNNLYGMNVERTVRYDVHELRIKDWESMIGQPDRRSPRSQARSEGHPRLLQRQPDYRRRPEELHRERLRDGRRQAGYRGP